MGSACSSSVVSPLKCTALRTVGSGSSVGEYRPATESDTDCSIDSRDHMLAQMGQLDAGDYDKFLARIATFFNDDGINHHWLSKPPSLSPPNCAVFGWRLTSCNMLTCELCGAKLFAEVSAKLPTHVVRKCLKEIERNLRSGHTKGCGYRFAPCPDHFKFISTSASAANLVAAFERRLESLDVLRQDLPCVTMEEFEELDRIKRTSDLKDTPTELVILALLGWEHHSTAYHKFVFIRCAFCFRKVCTMFYRKLTREEELLVEEAEQRRTEESSRDPSVASSTASTCSTSGGSDYGGSPGSLERKRRSSKDLLDARAAAQTAKKKRRPQDQLNPFFEHRSWCAWISRESRDSPIGWKVLLDLLVSHHKRIQDSRAPNQVLHVDVIEAAEQAVNNLRRKSDYWKESQPVAASSPPQSKESGGNNNNNNSENNDNNRSKDNSNNNNNNNHTSSSNLSEKPAARRLSNRSAVANGNTRGEVSSELSLISPRQTDTERRQIRIISVENQ